MTDVPFARDWLAERGFRGFERFSELDLATVPTERGVYVLLRESDEAPLFLEISPAGWFKGRDPTEQVDVLQRRWIDGVHCVYVGKADKSKRTNLQKRLKDFRKFGSGVAIGHYGGRYVWQLSDSSDYVVAWMVTDESPIDVEDRLVTEFEELFRQLPFGNINRPRRRSQ